ncbi:MAG: 30S ribosomal protein S20 [Gammaproteobacteria bacterium]
MANIASAKKRARQAVAHRAHNVALRSRYRTAVKNVLKAVQDGDKAAAADAYRSAVSIIDNTADKGMIHKNKAARHKSRLNAQIKAMS